MARVTANDVKQFIFGVSDGLTSALGVVIPLMLAHRPMFAVIMGLAICAAIGMGGGEYLSDKRGDLRSAGAMAVASFVGTLIPAVPFFLLPFHAAAVASAALIIVTGCVISEVKARDMHWIRAYLQTFGILAVASLATVGFALATGAAG